MKNMKKIQILGLFKYMIGESYHGIWAYVYDGESIRRIEIKDFDTQLNPDYLLQYFTELSNMKVFDLIKNDSDVV